MNIVEKNNVLPKKLEQELFLALTANNFPWFFINDITYIENNNSTRKTDQFGFIHMVEYPNSKIEWDPHFKKSMESVHALIMSTIPHFEKAFNLEYKKLGRIRIGMQTKVGDESIIFTPHTDSPKKHNSIIYYVNDSDGDTIFFKGQNYDEALRISPEKGKCIFFDGSLYHGGSSPVKNSRRIVINFLFEI